MIKTIINPFVSHTAYNSHAIFLSDSKEEIIKALQELHEVNCTGCHLFDFGFVDDRHKGIMPGNGYSLWWSTESMDEMEDEDINDYVNIETGEQYEIEGAKRMYVDGSIEMKQFGDEYLFYIEMYNKEMSEPDIDNVYMAWKLINEKIPLLNSGKDMDKYVFPKNNKKEKKDNVH